MVDFISLLFNYFDDVFVIGSTVFGYALFFLYYYKSSHWFNLQWADRILFSVLIGVSSFFFIVGLFIIPWSLYNELFKNYLLQKKDLYFLWLLIWATLFLFFYHRFKDYEIPYCETTKNYWKNIKDNKDPSLYVVALMFIIFHIFQRINYINMDIYLSDSLHFFINTFICYFMLYIFIPLFFYNLSFIPDVDLSFRFNSLIFNRNYFSNSERNIKYLKFLFIFCILSYGLTSLDSTYGIYTPKIIIIEEKVYDDIDMHIINHLQKFSIPIIERTLTYHINQPLLYSFGFFPITNVKFNNPSNITIPDKKYETTIEKGEFLTFEVEDAIISVMLEENWVEKIKFNVRFFQELDSNDIYSIDHKEVRYVKGNYEFINYTIHIYNIGNDNIRFTNFKLKDLSYNEDIVNYTTDNDEIYARIDKSHNELLLSCNLWRAGSITMNVVLIKGDN